MKEITLKDIHNDARYHWHGCLHSLPELNGKVYECYTFDGVYYQAQKIKVNGKWVVDIENAHPGWVV